MSEYLTLFNELSPEEKKTRIKALRSIGVAPNENEGFWTELGQGFSKGFVEGIRGFGKTGKELGSSFADDVVNWANETLERNQQWNEHENYTPLSLNMGNIGRTIGSGLGQTSTIAPAAIGASFVGSPLAGAAIVGGATFAQLYGDNVEDYRNKFKGKYSPGQITAMAVGKTLIDSTIETALGNVPMLGKISKGIVNKATKTAMQETVKKFGQSTTLHILKEAGKGAIGEGSEEVLQFFNDAAFRALAGDETLDVKFKDVLESFAGGAWSGGLMGSVSGITTKPSNIETNGLIDNPNTYLAEKHFKATPADKASNESLSTILNGMDAKVGEDVEVVTPKTKAAKMLKQLGTELGLDVNFFTPLTDKGRGINGAFNENDNRIWIDASKSAEDPRFTLGHEFYHFLNKNNPELANTFKDLVYSKQSQENEDIKIYNEEKQELEKEYQEGWQEEFVADRFGEIFKDAELWNRVGQSNNVKFSQQLMEYINKFLATVKKLLSKNPNAVNFIKDLDSFKQETIDKVLAPYLNNIQQVESDIDYSNLGHIDLLPSQKQEIIEENKPNVDWERFQDEYVEPKQTVAEDKNIVGQIDITPSMRKQIDKASHIDMSKVDVDKIKHEVNKIAQMRERYGDDYVNNFLRAKEGRQEKNQEIEDKRVKASREKVERDIARQQAEIKQREYEIAVKENAELNKDFETLDSKEANKNAQMRKRYGNDYVDDLLKAKAKEGVTQSKLTIDGLETPTKTEVAENSKGETELPEFVNVDELQIDPERFQFKENKDKKGVVTPLQGEFDQQTARPLFVWEDKDGNQFVVEGHHRLDLAKRTGAKKVLAYVHKESKTKTAEWARRRGVIFNIRDNKGSVRDFAEFFREDDITEDEARAKGLFRDDENGYMGFAIGRSSDILYNAFRNDDISAEKAFAIADVAKGDEKLESVGVAYASNKDKHQLKEFLKLLKKFPPKQAEEDFGGDLFGFDDSALQEADLVSAAALKHIKELKDLINKSKGSVKNPELVKQVGVSNGKKSKDKLKALQKKLSEYENYFTNEKIYRELLIEVGLLDKDNLDPKVKYSRYRQVNPILKDGQVKRDEDSFLDKYITERKSMDTLKKEAGKKIADLGGITSALKMAMDGDLSVASDVNILAVRSMMNTKEFSELPKEDRDKIAKLYHKSLGTEVGRALAARRLGVFNWQDYENVKAHINAYLAQVKDEKKAIEKVKEETGVDLNKELSSEKSPLQNPDKLHQVLESLLTTTKSLDDKAYEFWINSILSGPTSAIVNTLGNASNIAYELMAKRLVEATLNKFIFKKKGGATFEEFKQMSKALDWRRAKSNANFFWKHETLADNSKLDRANVAIGGKIGRIVRTPTKTLNYADEIAKTLIEQAEAATMATRLGKHKGLKGKQLENFIAEQLKDNDSPSWDYGRERAIELTFKKDPGTALQYLIALKNTKSPAGFVTRYFLPFIKGPANIISKGARVTPLGTLPLVKDLVKVATKKKQFDNESIARIAEQVIAWGSIMALVSLSGDDDEYPLITGSQGSLSATGRTFMRDKIPPYSIRIGGTYYSYKRLDPFATSLALIADGINSYRAYKGGAKSEEIIKNLVGAARSQFVDKSFFSAFNQLYQTLSTEGYAFKWGANFASSWMPNVVRQTVGYFNDNINTSSNQSKGRNWYENMFYMTVDKAGLLHASPKIDYLGREVKKDSVEASSPLGIIARIVALNPQSPDENMEKADRLLFNYAKQNPESAFYPDVPSYFFRHNGKVVYFTGDNYQEYAKDSGELAHKQINNAIKHGILNVEKPTEKDIKIIKGIFQKSRKLVKQRLIKENKFSF
jgi:hypothetical protein